MKQIIYNKELVGKTISKTLQSYQEFWIKFTDDSFVILDSTEKTEGYGYTQKSIEVSTYLSDNTNKNLVKFDLISQKTYELACQEQEKTYELRRQQREKEELEQEQARERQLYEQLKNKFNKD
jgi:FMN-dependent NADH-azoreductase